MNSAPVKAKMMHEVPAMADPTMIPVCTFDSGSALALFVTDGPVLVGLTKGIFALEGVGGKHPSIE